MPRVAPLMLCFGFLLATHCALASPPVEWSGSGTHRLLIRVDPVDLGGRTSDELPAEFQFDIRGALEDPARSAVGRTAADLASIQVMQYDLKTGKAVPYGKYEFAKHPADRPFVWYDAAIPYDFPEFEDSVDRTKGLIRAVPKLRGGYFYNAIGDGLSGRIAWTHTQRGNEPSYYAIYFSALPKGETARTAPPRGWLGDGMPRFDKLGSNTFGADHCRIDVDDWDGDGLVDVIMGESFGHIFWYPNRGTKQKPEFPVCHFVCDSKSVPIDCGDAAAPKIVDWDGDGNKDLLVGAEWNRILYFRNVGTNVERNLEYQGLLEIDGHPLALPIEPVAQASGSIFKRDYYPVLETVDWDADGDLDLLAGGYITGRIFFYENTGRDARNLPKLALRGPLEAEQGPINVGDWCAAPLLTDLDGDGDFDLISGNMPIGESRTQQQIEENRFLRYWENVGNARQARFAARSFPKEKPFPHGALASPRAADWDNDGDLDLIVSARENLFLFENTGSKSAPKFRVDVAPVPAPWGQSPLTVDQFRDWNNDGKVDLISGYTVHINAGKGNPFAWEKTEQVLPPGEYIAHPTGIGDDWFWPWLDDFDEDGKIDVLFGDWHGHVWFHRNLSTSDKKHFDTIGAKLALKSGAPIKVGPFGKNIETDFDALQGARTVFAVADFNRDQKRDLVVGDTYGKVRYFENVGTRAEPSFAAPIDIADLGIRLLVTATDWNNDGYSDIIAGAANGKVRVLLNNAAKGSTRFANGFDPKLPPIPQPRVLVVDLNGDGDDDLFLPSTQGACLIERSFLTHGYAKGSVIADEKR